MGFTFNSAGSRASKVHGLYGFEVLFIQLGQVERRHDITDTEEDAFPIHLPILQNPHPP